MKDHQKQIVYILIVVSVLLLSAELLLNWEASIALKESSTPLKLFLPTPSETFSYLVAHTGGLLGELAYTVLRSICGLTMGMALASVFCSCFFFSKKLKNVAEPFLHAINAFPVIGFTPLIILIFGQGSNLGIILISMLIAYFPIYITIQHALKSIPSGIDDISKISDATKIRDFAYIRLPEICTALLASLRLAIPSSIVGATIGEWLGTNNGIGHLTTVSLYRFQPEMMYSAFFLLVLFTSLCLMVINFIEKKYFKKRM
jgi:ABC-type nitrate/sulfonate/bicarbonate transport system permease component